MGFSGALIFGGKSCFQNMAANCQSSSRRVAPPGNSERSLGNSERSLGNSERPWAAVVDAAAFEARKAAAVDIVLGCEPEAMAK